METPDVETLHGVCMTDDTPPLAFSRYQSEAEAGRQRLARAARSGSAVRVVRGAYMSAEEWEALNPRQRYVSRIHAVAEMRRWRPVISHQSAAALHGLPILGPWPRAVHVTQLPGIGAHSRAALVKHSARIPDADLVSIDGLLVTSLARTVIDIATASDLMAGVVTADAALFDDQLHGHPALLLRQELMDAFARATPMRAHSRALSAISFAETGAQTPIESVSRVNMKALRVPRPQLQVPHYDALGFIGSTDFCWADFGAVAEADGDKKYLDQSARGGRAPEQVLLDEKRREDRLRALPRRVARWPWAVAMDPVRLRAKLRQLGLPFNVDWQTDVL